FTVLLYLFFFSSRRRHTRFSRDWSSDVCSSDLIEKAVLQQIENLLSGKLDARLNTSEPEGMVEIATAMNMLSEKMQKTHKQQVRSEERRVGKECRSRKEQYNCKKTTKTSNSNNI